MEKSQKPKAVIFGAGGVGQTVYNRICADYNIIAFADNNEQKQKTKLNNLPIIAPTDIVTIEFDHIFIGADARESIIRQLTKLGVSRGKILDEPIKYAAYTARRLALAGAREIIKSRGLKGNVAEAGVFQGEFAAKINAAFPERTLYLFDTFEGFDKRDVILEDEAVGALEGEFNIDTSADYVLSKMPYKDKCIIKQGYFPDSAHDVDDSFVFVSLDMDLYKPTLEGLNFFFPKLSGGGYIFIHDYFNPRFSGVKKAVDEYAADVDIRISPLGDECTIIVTK